MSKLLGGNKYSIGRQALLDWVNDLLQLKYLKIEELASGAAFCQILDAIHPGTVAMNRVNFEAKNEPEVLSNYKILQETFDKNKIKQFLDVKTLVRGKFQALLEFLQWLYNYYSNNAPNEEYNPVERRKAHGKKEPTSQFSGVSPAKVERPPPVSTKKLSISEKPEKVATKSSEKVSHFVGGDEVTKIRKQVFQLDNEIEQKEQEKDFYYEKLTRIEQYCQQNDNKMFKPIFDILYETNPALGFLPPESDDDDDEDEDNF